MRMSDWSSDVCSSDLLPVADGRPNLLDSFFSGQIGSHGFDLRTVLPQFLRSRFDFRFIRCDDQVISVAGAAFCKFQTDPGGRAGHDREWAISHEKSPVMRGSEPPWSIHSDFP